MHFITIPEQHPGQPTPSAVVPTTAQLRTVLDLPLHPFMALRWTSQTLWVMRILSKEETHHSWSSLVVSCPLCFASPSASKQSINTRGWRFSLRHYLSANGIKSYLLIEALPEEQKTKLCSCLQDQFKFLCWSYCCYNVLQNLRFFARLFVIHIFFSKNGFSDYLVSFSFAWFYRHFPVFRLI